VSDASTSRKMVAQEHRRGYRPFARLVVSSVSFYLFTTRIHPAVPIRIELAVEPPAAGFGQCGDQVEEFFQGVLNEAMLHPN
jgi:hypothetical protein